MRAFALGSDSGDHVIVTIHGRPDEKDDWLNATIDVAAGAFHGDISAMLMTCDFPSFRRGLELLYDSLDGTAIFTTIERQLEIRCIGNRRGGIAIAGIVQDYAGDGNVLKFQLNDIDQTYLPSIIATLHKIESEYPNRCHPTGP